MSDNLDLTFLRRQIEELKAEGGKLKRDGSGSGQPPEGTVLEKRVEALEKVSQEVREKLVRLETKIEGLEKTTATKTDIAELKTTIAEGFTSQTKWFISTAIALAVIAFTAAKFIHA